MAYRAPNEAPPDLLYILGTGSLWNNNEIRYSLRSVERHLPHGKVFIVGHLPAWARNVAHVEAKDPYPHKLRNSIHKTMRACRDARLGERFAIMNDDFFLVRNFPRVRTYYRGRLAESIARHPTKAGYYFEAMKMTLAFLKERGVADPLDYAVHCPMVFEKKKALEACREIGERGLLFRTVYGNLHGAGGYPRGDTKIRSMKELRAKMYQEIDMISSDDGIAQTRAFRRWIEARYPKPSRYEIEGIEDVLKRPVRYYATRRMNWEGRAYGKGEIIEGIFSPRVIRENGMVPVEEAVETESGGEI